MEFIMTNVLGDMSSSSDLETIPTLVNQLDQADPEHPDVSLRRPDGWTLSASRNGDLILENVDAKPASPRHMAGVGRSRMADLMRLLALGDFAALDREEWRTGYPWSTR